MELHQGDALVFTCFEILSDEAFMGLANGVKSTFFSVDLTTHDRLAILGDKAPILIKDYSGTSLG